MRACDIDIEPETSIDEDLELIESKHHGVLSSCKSVLKNHGKRLRYLEMKLLSVVVALGIISYLSWWGVKEAVADSKASGDKMEEMHLKIIEIKTKVDMMYKTTMLEQDPIYIAENERGE